MSSCVRKLDKALHCGLQSLFGVILAEKLDEAEAPRLTR
jgi:hypothetical protein